MAIALPVTRADLDRLLDVQEVPHLLGMSEAWVRQHSNGLPRPAIPSIKLGRCVRFRREAATVRHWMTNEARSNLLEAIQDRVDAQAKLCSFGIARARTRT